MRFAGRILRISFILGSSLLAGSAWASPQVVHIATNTTMVNSATRYAPLGFVNLTSWSPTDTVYWKVSEAGTVSLLRVEVASAPGGVASWTFTAFKNTVATGLTCQMSGTDTSCADSSNSFTVSPNDNLSIQVVPAGTPTASRPRWSVLFTPTTDDAFTMGGGSAGGATAPSSALYFSPYGHDGTGNSTETSAAVVIPFSGTFDQLYVELDVTPPVGRTLIATLIKNGSSTGLTCSVSNGSLTCSDTSTSVSVVEGDLISMKEVLDAASGGYIVGFLFGVSFTSGVSGVAPVLLDLAQANASSTIYHDLMGSSLQGTTTESTHLTTSQQSSYSRLFGQLITPTAGGTYTFTIRQNQVDTDLTCTVLVSQTDCSDTGTLSIQDGDEITLSVTPGGSPTVPETELRASLGIGSGAVRRLFRTY